MFGNYRIINKLGSRKDYVWLLRYNLCNFEVKESIGGIFMIFVKILDLGYFVFVVVCGCCLLVGILKFFVVVLVLFFGILSLIVNVLVVWIFMIYRFLFCEILVVGVWSFLLS